MTYAALAALSFYLGRELGALPWYESQLRRVQQRAWTLMGAGLMVMAALSIGRP